MPEKESPDESAKIIPSKIISEIAERASRVNWDTELKEFPEGASRLYIAFPNGRKKRRIEIRQSTAEKLKEIPFEEYRALGDYEAINNPLESYIEAHIRPASRTLGIKNSIFSIPGVEIIRSPDNQVQEHEYDEIETPEEVTENPRMYFNPRRGDRWKLKIDDPARPWRIEISEASLAGVTLTSDNWRFSDSTFTHPNTLKIIGASATTHDEALHMLEDISGAVFFQLDLRYSVLYELTRYTPRRTRRQPRRQRIEEPPLMPRFRYPSEALTLYNYGRSAYGMPLLQYLAYYQVLEFFFPQHFMRHQLLRLQQELSDPRFNVTDDGHLAKIIAIATPGGRGSASEREQLKATVSGCTDEKTLRDFISDNTSRLEVLGDKKSVKNIPTINMNSSSILDQVAERIYALRCRIVHTKGDGGDAVSDFLLPGSQEAASMSIDVELVQFIAQKAIIASGTPMGY